MKSVDLVTEVTDQELNGAVGARSGGLFTVPVRRPWVTSAPSPTSAGASSAATGRHVQRRPTQ